MATMKDAYNPNHLKKSDFNIYVGNSVNTCDEYVWREMENFKHNYGTPNEKANQFTYKFSKADEKFQEATAMTMEMIKKFNWYKGDKLWSIDK